MLVARETIRNVVFIDITYILHCFPTDFFSRQNFNVTKPDIGIKPGFTGLVAQPIYLAGPALYAANENRFWFSESIAGSLK